MAGGNRPRGKGPDGSFSFSDGWSGGGSYGGSNTGYEYARVAYNGYHGHGISDPTHNHTLTNKSSGGTESRPNNYTYIIWKRIN